MAKKRVIFKLIFENDLFCLSRNFRLQKIGSVDWLFEKMNFSNISEFIDELVILNASRNNYLNPITDNFKKNINKLMKKTFIPLTIGGGLRTLKQIDECFSIGADKVVLNSAVRENIKLIDLCYKKYGSQAVTIGIDVKKINNNYYSFTNNGENKFLTLSNHIKILKKKNFGEIMINSIDRDGTGFGFEDDILNYFNLNIPLIFSGGAGKPDHFEKLINNKKISALMTGNLYNFLGDGLKELRNKIIKNRIDLRVL